VIWATAAALGASALLPHHLDPFSRRQQAARFRTNRQAPPELRVPAPLDPHRLLEWVQAWPSAGGPPRWVPAAAVFYGYRAVGEPIAIAHSNGCAGGPTYTYAIQGACLELVERDSVALWHYSRALRPAVDPDLVGAALAKDVRDALDRSGRNLHFLDITSDLGIPVVVAVSRRREGPPGWALGFGAAATLGEAADRAARELTQTIHATDAPGHPNPIEWADTVTPEECPHLLPHGIAPPRGPADVSVAGLTRAFTAQGIETYVVDQTHSLIGTPVVRVLAPGLAFWWRRLGSRRLLEAPYRMGWIGRPLTERDVNPLDLTL